MAEEHLRECPLVLIVRDHESGRWYIAESDMPGLWLEADSPAALIARIVKAAPEIMEMNAGINRTVRLTPDYSEIDALLAGLPKQPFREGQAFLDDLVTAEHYLVSALTGEFIVRFKPTDKLIRQVAALRAGD
jgi:hypothetical protein